MPARRSSSFFELLFGTIVVLTLLCGGFAGCFVFFMDTSALTQAQDDVLQTALDGFKFGLSAILGLLGGYASAAAK